MREFGQELLAAVGDRRSRLHLRLPQASRSRRSLQDVSLYRRGLALVVFWLAELRGASGVGCARAPLERDSALRQVPGRPVGST